MAHSHPVFLSPDFNDTPVEIPNTSSLEYPCLCFQLPAMSVKQLLATQTNEVQQLSAQLSLFQRMYQDIWQKFSQLKK
ncbi:hypothetical protein ACSBR1_018421 [Camellia fascicularis]